MKPNKKQIEASLRNKLAAQYTAKVADLKKEIEDLHEANKEYRTRAYKAEQEKLELQDKVNQYEEWIERLQEYMDMSEEDRQAHLETLRAKSEYDKLLNGSSTLRLLNHMTSLLFT